MVMKKLRKIFDFAIVMSYIIMGCLLLFKKDIFTQVIPMFRNIFGIILILYGIFRANQFYSKYIVNKEDENS
jgi:hypothetical protein